MYALTKVFSGVSCTIVDGKIWNKRIEWLGGRRFSGNASQSGTATWVNSLEPGFNVE